MRAFSRYVFIPLLAVLVWAGIPAAASAQELEALKRELEQLKQSMQAIQERIQRLEVVPSLVAAKPVAQVSPREAPPVRDLLTPREPFAPAERRGRQLLFDIGVAGDFVGNLVQRSIDKANAGTFSGQENRFFPREVELALLGMVDPFARADVSIEVAEEFEDGKRKLEVSLEEAYMTLLTLPLGTQLKLGKLRPRFGLLNLLHQHALPQVDRPNVLARFFGQEGLNEQGAAASWVLPTPFFQELSLGLFTGDNETAFGRSSLKAPLVTGRLRNFFELDEWGALQVGISGASGETGQRHRSTLAGFDAKYKWRADVKAWPVLTLAGEAIYSDKIVDIFNPETSIQVSRTRERFGWYTYAEFEPTKRWTAGLRFDATQFSTDPGNEWAVSPYLTFKPSDFLQFRFQYKHTGRDLPGQRMADEFFLQAGFILGAHPAHPF